MKISKANKLSIAIFAALACVTLAASIPAFAIPPNQAIFFEHTPNFAGVCCFSWDESVTINEPATVAPVVVRWDADYQSDGYQFNGIMLNGSSSCVSYGSSAVPEGEPIGGAVFTHQSYQWVILPSNGLTPGKNTFTLCGGGAFGTAIHTHLGFNTLVVQISK
jgi:hypothetical protein